MSNQNDKDMKIIEDSKAECFKDIQQLSVKERLKIKMRLARGGTNIEKLARVNPIRGSQFSSYNSKKHIKVGKKLAVHGVLETELREKLNLF